MIKLLKLAVGCLSGLLLFACRSDEPIMPEGRILTRAEEGHAKQHVSQADFDKYVLGKIWAHRDVDFEPLSKLKFVNDLGEYDFCPWVGFWFGRAAMEFSDNLYIEFDFAGMQWDTSTMGPKMHRFSCVYEYDEETGMITCPGQRICYGQIYPESMYLESVTEDVMVLREHIGILPGGYNGDAYSAYDEELRYDLNSYCRVVYYAQPEVDKPLWYANYVSLQQWHALKNSAPIGSYEVNNLVKRLRRYEYHYMNIDDLPMR